MPSNNPIERGLERTMFALRWLMAPMYLGLAVALAMLVIVFLREVAYYAPQVLAMSADSSILAALTLIDLTLAANLLLIVLFSGYESFVSARHWRERRPAGLDGHGGFRRDEAQADRLDRGDLGIHLLKRFMEIGKGTNGVNERELRWLVIIHGSSYPASDGGDGLDGAGEDPELGWTTGPEASTARVRLIARPICRNNVRGRGFHRHDCHIHTRRRSRLGEAVSWSAST